MCDTELISHDQSNIPTLSDIRKKVIELNSIDLLDESKNKIFFDDLSESINNLSISCKENDFKIENITEIVEEIFSIVFLLSENEQPQLSELISPLFILKSVSKSILSQFCIFLKQLKKNNPEIEFDEDIVGFLNSTKEILIQAIRKDQPQIEFIDSLTSSTFNLTLKDSIKILSIILFLTDKYLDKSNITDITQFLIAPFQGEVRVPPFFIDFLSNIIRIDLIKEIESVLTKQTLEMLDNETLILLIENPLTNDIIFADICKIANNSKNQPLCNAVALNYIPSKVSKHLISDKLILQIINNCTIENFSLEFWNEVGNFETNVNLSESIIERITNRFSNEVQQETQTEEVEENKQKLSLQTVLSKLVFDPHSILSHKEAVRILTESNDNIAINCILTINFNDDVLTDPYFWNRYSRNFKREKLNKNAIQCFWFRYRQNQIKLSDVLFHCNIKPNENTCHFIQNVFDYFNSTFLNEEPNLNQIIYENVSSPLFPSFWRIFKGYRIVQLYNESPEEKKFFFYYGLCCNSGLISPPIDVISFRKLSNESYEYLYSIIDGSVSISFESELPENIQSDLLFFISSTIMCINIRSIELIKEISFFYGPDFFLFLALLSRIYLTKLQTFPRIFDGKCLYDAFENAKLIIDEDDSIKNINMLFDVILKNSKQTISTIIDRFFTVLSGMVDVLWEKYKEANILSIFPRFNELIYHIYYFHLTNKNEHYTLSSNHEVEGFPKVLDHGIIQMLFEYYQKNSTLYTQYPCLPQCADVSELLKNPKPELFSFLNSYLDIDYSKIKEDQFDENLIISSFLEHFKINQTRNKSLNLLISILNETQISSIINEFIDFISFDSLIQIILSEMPYNDQIKILSIEKYLKFIRKEVYKTLYYVLKESDSQHELFPIINEYFQNHKEINLVLDSNDPNFLNFDELNQISNSSLFDLDEILNSSFGSEKERISESILFLLKYTIHKIANHEEIPEEIQTKLFLPSTKTIETDEQNFELLPTFESFSNLRNVCKFIFEEFLILQKENELFQFLNSEQLDLLKSISEEINPTDLKNQAFFIIKSCPSFKTNDFPVLDILKMHLLNQVNFNAENAFYNAIHMRLCSGSTGVLYYIHFLQSYSPQLKVEKIKLYNFLTQCFLNTPDSLSCLEEAISKLFISVEDKYLFYLDINYSLLKKPSRQSIQFIRNNLLKGPFTNTYFQFLSSLSFSYPNLLAYVFDVDECNFDDESINNNKHDVIWFINKILPFINEKENADENILNESHKNRTESILYLICNLLKIPKLADQVIQFFFDNLLEFSFEVISAFFHILRMGCDCSYVQTIIVGYLIRYNFPELANQIIDKINSNEEDQKAKYQVIQNYIPEEQKFEILAETPNKTIEEPKEEDKNESLESINKRIEQSIKNIYDIYHSNAKADFEYIRKTINESITYLLLLLIRYEENEINDSYEISLMISKREKPFLELSELPFDLSPEYHQWSPNYLDIINPSVENFQFRSRLFIPLQDSDKDNLKQLIDNIETTEYDYRPPPDIPIEYFHELPNEYANQLIVERIPRLNTKITPDVYERLLKYPAWVSNWIIHRPSVTLLQQQYDIITNCIEEINSMNSNDLYLQPRRSFNSFTKKSECGGRIREIKKKKKIKRIEKPFLNYENICEFIYKSEIYNDRENSNLLYTLFLYIAAHKPYKNNSENENDEEETETEAAPNPKDVLVYYAKKMLKETTFISNYRSILFSFNPIANEIVDDVIDVACSPLFRTNSDFLESILHFYKSKAFYKGGKVIESNPQANHANHNNNNLPNNNNNNNNQNNNQNNFRNDFRIALNNNDIVNIQYLLNHHPLIRQNDNNNTNNNNNNNNTNNDENDEEDFSDIDEKYRYDFFVILTMSESPKVLTSAFIYAPKHLINASIQTDSCISNAFLRCLNSKDIQKYTHFFNHLKDYKNFYERHEEQIIERIRSLLSDPDYNSSQIVSLFSMLSYQKIDDPKKVCEEFYETLTPFWQLVYDARDFISKALLEENNLINTSFQFMKPVVHTLSFDFRLKYLKIFVRELITTKTRSIVVRRENILEDSFKIIMNMSPSEFLGHISVNFDGERGIDAGGLLRDWFTNLTKALFNENYALFVSSKVHGTFLPNPNSYVNGNHLKYFEFAGRIFARAIVEQINLEPHLALSLRKKLLKYDLTIDDIEEFDPELFESLKWILESDLSQNPDFEMYFTADTDNIGKHEVYELIENGAKTLVTDENKQMFVQKTIEYRTDVAIQDQCCAFCTGFFSIIPYDKIGIFTPDELDRIICGEGFIDVDDWQKNCHFTGQFSINHPTIVMFFNVIKKWDQKDIAKLLSFITGSPQVPLGGFSAYKELGRPMTIGSVDGRDKLITAHTCSNLLDLPEYETETELNDKIRLAIHECNSFDFH